MANTLKNATIQNINGGKINGLIRLMQLDLKVPDGLIITNTKDRAALKSELSQFMTEGKTYIVRSSGQKEDGVNASYAGQYTSVRDCRTLEDVRQGIKECLASQRKEGVKAYSQALEVGEVHSQLAILVQEQIEADMSGIAFSMNPLNNHDQEILLETIEGSGEALADGRVEPQRQIISWHSPQADPQLEALRQSLLKAVGYFGYPLDIEFCFSNGHLYLLQARPITRQTAKVSLGSWTTANFRDGGVAAQACPALMWSLYRDAWQTSLESFMLDNGLLADQEIYRLALVKYARPYWNVGLVKVAMSRIPGYTEREFDDELGIQKTYSGDGEQSQLTPKSLWQLAKVAHKLSNTSRQHQKQVKEIKAELLARYEDYEKQLAELAVGQPPLGSIEKLWQEIIFSGHLASESNYFKQVFINTVQLSMQKTAILKHMSLEGFFQLISKLGNVSHLRPTTDLQLISDLIQQNSDLNTHWKTSSTQQLIKEVEQALNGSATQRADLTLLVNWLRTYGYHSERELNLLWPSFIEEPVVIIEKIKGLLLDNGPSLSVNQSLSAKEMERILQTETDNPRYTKRIRQRVLYLRELLWWREEFKDISTRYYHLVRQISLLLGENYKEKGYLKEVDDLFYLEKETVDQWINQTLPSSQLQQKADDNRLYCQAYRNYEPAGDLQASSQFKQSQQTSGELQGIGANDGVVTGRVRVLRDVSEISHLQADEILVTPFTDTGWSHRFASLKGLITETGGVLSHATIVAREFGLPAIIGAKQATKSLRTGMVIQMNGTTGTIHIIKHSKDESR